MIINNKNILITKKSLLLWFLLAFFCAPTSIFIHETGHYIGAKVLGYANTELHYASVSRGNSPEKKESKRKRGLIVASGPFITLISTLLCFLFVIMTRNPFFIVLGILLPLRSIATLIAGISLLFRVDAATLQKNDEVKLAGFLDIPLVIPIGISVLLLITTLMFMVSKINKLNRKKIILSIIVGTILGSWVWLNFFGPQLLP